MWIAVALLGTAALSVWTLLTATDEVTGGDWFIIFVFGGGGLALWSWAWQHDD
jgi:hypothetical protein